MLYPTMAAGTPQVRCGGQRPMPDLWSIRYISHLLQPSHQWLIHSWWHLLKSWKSWSLGASTMTVWWASAWRRGQAFGGIRAGRLSALSVTFTWASHQGFEVTTFHLLSERFFHFKKVEIQDPPPTCQSCQCQFSVIWLILVQSAYMLTI